MPLKRRCSTKAAQLNMIRCVREGRAAAQCAAIMYSTLKKACGVRSTKRMTPKQIVAHGKRRRR